MQTHHQAVFLARVQKTIYPASVRGPYALWEMKDDLVGGERSPVRLRKTIAPILTLGMRTRSSAV